MIAIGSKERWHLELAQHWIIQYNFYINDQRLGRMFVRMCPYLAFSARVCLNQHYWLANRMRQAGIDFMQCSNAFLRCTQPQALQELADFFGCSRSCELRAKMARLSDSIFQTEATPHRRLPTPAFLLPGGVLRQSDLSSPSSAGSTRGSTLRCQSDHRPAQQNYCHLWA
jgi:hypothetical protein